MLDLPPPDDRFDDAPILLNGRPAHFNLQHDDVVQMRFGYVRIWVGKVRVLGPNGYTGTVARIDPAPHAPYTGWHLGAEVYFTRTAVFEVYRERMEDVHASEGVPPFP